MYGELAMNITFTSTWGAIFKSYLPGKKEISLSDCFGAVVQDPGHSS